MCASCRTVLGLFVFRDSYINEEFILRPALHRWNGLGICGSPRAARRGRPGPGSARRRSERRSEWLSSPARRARDGAPYGRSEGRTGPRTSLRSCPPSPIEYRDVSTVYRTVRLPGYTGSLWHESNAEIPHLARRFIHAPVCSRFGLSARPPRLALFAFPASVFEHVVRRRLSGRGSDRRLL